MMSGKILQNNSRTHNLSILQKSSSCRAEQHYIYITDQNEEAKLRETKNRCMITKVNLVQENISAESPKESKDHNSLKKWSEGTV